MKWETQRFNSTHKSYILNTTWQLLSITASSHFDTKNGR